MNNRKENILLKRCMIALAGKQPNEFFMQILPKFFYKDGKFSPALKLLTNFYKLMLKGYSSFSKRSPVNFPVVWRRINGTLHTAMPLVTLRTRYIRRRRRQVATGLSLNSMRRRIAWLLASLARNSKRQPAIDKLTKEFLLVLAKNPDSVLLDYCLSSYKQADKFKHFVRRGRTPYIKNLYRRRFFLSYMFYFNNKLRVKQYYYKLITKRVPRSFFKYRIMKTFFTVKKLTRPVWFFLKKRMPNIKRRFFFHLPWKGKFKTTFLFLLKHDI